VTTVGISSAQLIQFYPRLYHMAEEGTWENIRRNGLLSTSALLDFYEKTGQERYSIESEHRPELSSIVHPSHGSAVIRDQKPMSETALRQCLIDLEPREWYELLNSKVFFWPTRQRLLRLLSARAYRNRIHCVITVDTAKLVERYEESIKLSPINSGSTIYVPQPRGRNTFLPLQQYPFEARRRLRGIKDAIAEITVEHSVPDIAELAVEVVHMEGQRVIEVLYQQ
jgi:hypothetical protein